MCYTLSHKGQHLRIYLSLELSVGNLQNRKFPIFCLKDIQVDIKVEVRAGDWLSGKEFCIACMRSWDPQERGSKKGGETFQQIRSVVSYGSSPSHKGSRGCAVLISIIKHNGLQVTDCLILYQANLCVKFCSFSLNFITLNL